MAIDEESFRACLRRWATGVTIVSARVGDAVHGMTVSDFSGASLSPPLVTVCANRQSTTTKMIAEGGCFGVSVLAADQQDLSNHFASSKTEGSRFVDVAYGTAETGAPLIDGAIVRLDCRLESTYEAGDHVIYLGEILWAEHSEGHPLLYWGGRYRALSEKE